MVATHTKLIENTCGNRGASFPHSAEVPSMITYGSARAHALSSMCDTCPLPAAGCAGCSASSRCVACSLPVGCSAASRGRVCPVLHLTPKTRATTLRAPSVLTPPSSTKRSGGYTNYRGFGFPSLQSSFGTRPTGRSAVRRRRTMAFGRLQELLPGHL